MFSRSTRVVSLRKFAAVILAHHVQSAAANYLCPSMFRANRVCLGSFGVGAMPIQAPFRHARVHIPDPPGIDSFRFRACVAGRKWCSCPGAADVLPFRFCGKSVDFAFFFTQPLAESHSIIPTHSRSVRMVILVPRIIGLEELELLNSYLSLRDMKRPGNGHFMSWGFVIIAPFESSGSPLFWRDDLIWQRGIFHTHHEVSMLNSDHLHAG